MTVWLLWHQPGDGDAELIDVFDTPHGAEDRAWNLAMADAERSFADGGTASRSPVAVEQLANSYLLDYDVEEREVVEA